MDVLCSDKTGTLTLGALTMQSAVDVLGAPSEDVLRWACINSALETGVRSPLDTALLAHEHSAIAAYAKRAELPFDFEAVVVDHGVDLVVERSTDLSDLRDGVGDQIH